MRTDVALVLAAAAGYAGFYSYNVFVRNRIPRTVDVAARHLVSLLDQCVEDEVVVDENAAFPEEVPEDIAEAARAVQYESVARGPKRWKARHYSVVTKAAIALKEKFGLVNDSEANRLMGSKWVRKWMIDKGMRPSHVVSSYLSAVEVWLTASADEAIGIQMRHTNVMRRRKKRALEGSVPNSFLNPSNWLNALSGTESVASAFSTYSSDPSH